MVGTSCVMNIGIEIEVTGDVVGDPQDWMVLTVGPYKRMYSSFDYSAIHFYEYMFTRIGLWLLFSYFEVVILKNFKVSPSQLHPRSWDYMRVFELCDEHKS